MQVLKGIEGDFPFDALNAAFAKQDADAVGDGAFNCADDGHLEP